MRQRLLIIINLALILVCLNLGIQQVHAQFDREELIETISFSGANGPVNGVSLLDDYEGQLDYLYEYYGSDANNIYEISLISEDIIGQYDPSLNDSVGTLLVDYGVSYIELIIDQEGEQHGDQTSDYDFPRLELIPINGDLSIKNMLSFYGLELSKNSQWTIQGEQVQISILGHDFATVMSGADGRLINVYFTSLDTAEVEEVFAHLQLPMSESIEEAVYGSSSIGVHEFDGQIVIVTYDQQGKYSISLSYNPADVKKALGFAMDNDYSY